MKKTLLLAGAALLLGAGAVRAETSWDARREALLKAGPEQKLAVRRMIRHDYPQFGSRMLQFATKRDEKFLTQAAIARLRAIQQKDAEAVAQLPARVMEDMHAKYPHLIPSVAILFWSQVENDPSFATDLIEQVRGQHPRAAIAKKYPTLREDVLRLVREKHPQLPARLRAEVAALVAKTDPTLRLDIAIDAMRIVREQAPGAMLRRPGRGRFFGVMAHNPKAAVAVWQMIEEKYDERLYNVMHAVAADVGARHGAELLALGLDVAEMVDAKYPTLPAEAARTRMARRLALAGAMEGKHADFATQLAAGLQQKYPDLFADLVASVDRHAPHLRADLRQAMAERFPGLREDTERFVQEQFPELVQLGTGTNYR